MRASLQQDLEDREGKLRIELESMKRAHAREVQSLQRQLEDERR